MNKKNIGLVTLSIIAVACLLGAIILSWNNPVPSVSKSESNTTVIDEKTGELVEIEDTTEKGEKTVSSNDVSVLENLNLLECYSGYLKNFVEEHPEDNIVISPEALNSWLSIYSNILDDSDKDKLKAALDKDYTGYKFGDNFKVLNKIFIDTNTDIKDFDALSDISVSVNMQDNSAIDSKKTFIYDAILEQLGTDDGISNFLNVREYNKDTGYNIVNMTEFNGHLLDSNSQATTFRFDKDSDEGLHSKGAYSTPIGLALVDGDYFGFKTCHVYKMPYADNYNFVVILPRKEYSISDIDIVDIVDKVKNNSDEAYKYELREDDTIPVMCFLPYFVTYFDSNITLSDLGLGYLQNKYPTDNIEQYNAFSIWDSKSVILKPEISMSDLRTANKDTTDLFIYVNRPFIFYVEDIENDGIAYLGAINKLSKKQ